MRKARVWATVAVAAVSLAIAMDASAQRGKKTKPDASQGAAVSQGIGANGEIAITYHRPGVKGRNVWEDQSENKAIGALVPKNGDPWPWRAGANEATTFTINEDMLIEGTDLPAGTYGLFMIPTGNNNWTIIFNKVAKQWGSFKYDKTQDVLRVDVKSVAAPMTEWLFYGFDDPDANSCVAYLQWEKVKIPFKIEMKNKN